MTRRSFMMRVAGTLIAIPAVASLTACGSSSSPDASKSNPPDASSNGGGPDANPNAPDGNTNTGGPDACTGPHC